MVIRVSDKTQNYSKVTKLLVKPFKMRMSESDPSEFQTWDNDPQASVLDRAENMSLLIILNGYIQ